MASDTGPVKKYVVKEKNEKLTGFFQIYHLHLGLRNAYIIEGHTYAVLLSVKKIAEDQLKGE